MLDMSWTAKIGQESIDQEPQNLFIRKVDVNTEGGKELVDWIRENHLKKHSKSGAGLR
jgi:hypothetical protein